jgi:hypothetical protein
MSISRACVRVIIAASVAGISAHCTMVDTVDGRFQQINRSSATARNESILLNIVRASRNAPLNFVAISRLSGTTQATAGAGLPSLLTGPYPIATGARFATNAALGAAATFNIVEPGLTRDVGIGSTTLNASTNASNSFDLTVLESKEFYSALLSPVDLPTLNYFIRQGYSHELLFWLFTDSVRETVAGHTFEYRNRASRPCEMVLGHERCFDDLVDVAVGSGLTVETQAIAAGGGRGARAVHARFCFDPVLAERARKEYSEDIQAKLFGTIAGHRPRCGTWLQAGKKENPNGETDTLTFDVLGTPYGPIRYQIITRSTFGIYQFLGQILAEQASDTIRLRGRNAGDEDTRILAIERGHVGGACFVELTFEGESYCVPEQGAHQTKRIFSLLVQLLALKTPNADLAITPTVRVTP